MKTLQRILKIIAPTDGALQNPSTWKYFVNQANIFMAGGYDNEYENVLLNQDIQALLNIVEVKNGYIVLKDGTIKCSDDCSSYVATYDGCEESEMRHGIWNMMRGY